MYFFFLTIAHSIIESESAGGSNIAAYRTGTPITGQESKSFYRISCPGLSECVPLEECPELLLETARQCYRGDFSLSCGVNELEPHVCCSRQQQQQIPQPGGFNDRNTDVGCGKSIVQGDYYHGLGAYPFVARVGFKSEYERTDYLMIVMCNDQRANVRLCFHR